MLLPPCSWSLRLQILSQIGSHRKTMMPFDYKMCPTPLQKSNLKESKMNARTLKAYQLNLSRSKESSDDSFGSHSFFRAGGAMARTRTAGIGSSAAEGPSDVVGEEVSEFLLRDRLRVSWPLDSGAPSSSSIGAVDSNSYSSSSSRWITPSGRGGKLEDTF